MKLSNWRDERGSELTRAKKLLRDKSISLMEVADRADIPYQTIKNYRQDIDKLENASWSRVNKLSQLYDMYVISRNMSQEDTLIIMNEIHEMMSDLKQGTMDTIIAESIEQIITSDPNAIHKIYKDLDSKLPE